MAEVYTPVMFITPTTAYTQQFIGYDVRSTPDLTAYVDKAFATKEAVTPAPQKLNSERVCAHACC